MVTIIIVGVLAWALKEAAEDVIRTWRGDPPPAQRKGFRGYIEDRWNALAEKHHRAEAAGHISQLDAWSRRRHLARKKALARAGFATDEEIARAAAEHRRRMALIEQGIDPDAAPEPTTVREPEAPAVEPDPEPAAPAVPEPTVDDHFNSNTATWGTEFADAPTTSPDPWAQAQPWDPFATSNTKETTMSNNGEITGPASVLQFHNDLKTAMNASMTIVDTLTGLAADLEARAAEVARNITATETASTGMIGLGMEDAAAAARALMEAQSTIQTALTEAAAIGDYAGVISDQVAAAQTHLAAIKAAHDAQLLVQDARAAAGRGRLATDSYLDGND